MKWNDVKEALFDATGTILYVMFFPLIWIVELEDEHPVAYEIISMVVSIVVSVIASVLTLRYIRGR